MVVISGCVLVYRYTKERNINELRHNSMYGYENNRNSPCTGTPGQPLISRNITLENIPKRDTKKSLLILTLQHKSAICTINAQKQILEMKIYLAASM